MRIITLLLALFSFVASHAQFHFASVDGSNYVRSNQVYAQEHSIITLEIRPNMSEWTWSGPMGYTAEGPGVYILDFSEDKAGTYTATRNVLGLEETLSFDVHFLTENFVDLGADLMLCGDQEVVLRAPSGHNYIWSTEATTDSIVVSGLNNASYSVTVTTDYGDSAASSVSVINIEDQVQYKIISHDLSCSAELQIEAPTGYAEYIWSNGQEGSTVMVDIASTNYLTVDMMATDGCQTQIQYLIEETEGIVDEILMPLTRICAEEELTLIAPEGFDSYIWFDGTTSDSLIQIVDENIDYYVDAFMGNGCATRHYFTVDVMPRPSAIFQAFDANSDQMFGTLNITLDHIESEMFPIDISLMNGEGNFYSIGTMSGPTASISLYEGVYYGLLLTTIQGCHDLLGDFQIGYDPTTSEQVMPPTSGCPGEQVTLSGPADFQSYFWNNGETTETIDHIIDGTTIVSVQALDGMGNASIYIFPINALDGLSASYTTQAAEGSQLGSLDITLSNPGLDVFPVDVVVSTANGGSQSIGSMTSDMASFALESGMYSGLTLVANEGCSAYLGNFQILYETSYTEETMAVSELCAGEELVLTAPSGFDSYVWDSGETTQDLENTYSQSTSKSVEATDELGNVVNYIFPIEVNALVEATLSTTPAQGTTDGSVDVTLINVESTMYPITVWFSTSVSEQQVGTMTSDMFSMSLPVGNYTGLKLRTAQGCESMLEDFTISYASSYTEETMAVSEACQGEDLVLTAPSGFVSYVWDSGETSQSLVTSLTTSTNKNVEATDELGNVVNFIYPIEVSELVQAMHSTTPAQGSSDGSLDIALTDVTSEMYPISVLFISSMAEQIIGTMTSEMFTISLSEGDYSGLTLRTAEGCDTALEDFSIAYETSYVEETMDNTMACPGEMVTLTAPSGYQSYVWDSGENSASYTGNFATNSNKSVEATDEQGNVTNYIFPIEMNDLVEATFSTQPAQGANGGAVNINIVNGTSTMYPIAVLVGTTMIEMEIGTMNSEALTIALAEGVYSDLTLRTAQGCETVLGDFEIEYVTSYAEETLNITELCADEMVTLSAPTGFNSYTWDSGETASSITTSFSESTSKYVEVTDEQGNVTRYIFPIEINDLPEATFTTQGAQGVNGGAIDINLSNATSAMYPISVLVSSSMLEMEIGTMTSQTLNIALAIGNYSDLTLRTADGCETVLGDFEIEYIPSYTEVEMNVSEICYGETLTLEAPMGFTSYLWDSGQNSRSISDNYTANVTKNVEASDELGNVTNFVFPVEVNEFPEATFTTQPAQGANGGALNINLSNGSGEMYPVSVLVSSSTLEMEIGTMSSGTLSIALAEGNYTGLTLRTVNGCETLLGDFDIEYVTSYTEVTMALTELCSGDMITLTAPSDFTSYSWDSGETSQSLNGSYTANTSKSVEATDNLGNVTNYIFPIEVNALPQATFSTQSAQGNNDGALDVNLTNGESAMYPISVLASNSVIGTMNSSTVSIPLAEGNYTDLTLITVDGCENVLGSFVIDYNASNTTETMAVTELCSGESATLAAPSGFVSYLWDSGETSMSLTGNFNADVNKNVIATDNQGNTVTYVFPIVVNSNPEGSFTTVPAQGNNDGSLNINLTNAESSMYPVSVLASNSVIGTMNSSMVSIPLAEGNYTDLTLVTVDGCENVLGSFVIDYNASNTTETMAVTELCSGESATLAAPSGFVSYLWDSGETSMSLTGNFNADVNKNVIATDNQGNTVTYVFPIVVNSNPEGSFTTVPAQGNNDGSLNINLTNAESSMYPVSVLASNSVIGTMNSPMISIALAEGNYTDLTLVTVDGCTEVLGNFVIDYNTSSTTETMAITETCAGESVTLTAPSGFVSYLWDSGQTTNFLTASFNSNVNKTVTATDAQGNVTNYVFPIEVIQAIGFAYSLSQPMDCGQEGTLHVNLSNTNASDFPIALTIDGPGNNDTQINLTSNQSNITLSAANYSSVQLVTNRGCVLSEGGFTLDVYSEVITENAPTLQVVCPDAMYSFSAYNGYANYQWSTGQTTQSVNLNLSQQPNVNVIMTDNNGCGIQLFFPYQIPSIPNVTTQLTQPQSCGAMGSATFQVTNDALFLPLSLEVIQNGNAVQTVSVNNNSVTINLASGQYDEVRLVSGAGCTFDFNGFTINSTQSTQTVTESVQRVCTGTSVTLAANAAASYSWSTGQTSSSISVSPIANMTYTVQEQDGNGCIVVREFPIEVWQAANSAISLTHPQSCGELGSIEINFGQLPAGNQVANLYIYKDGSLYQTFTPSSNVFTTPLASGVYDNVEIVTEQGCWSTTGGFEINAFSGSYGSFDADPVALCEGQEITLVAVDPTGEFLWSTGETTESIVVSPTSNTTYTCVITYSDGCTFTVNYPVEVGSPIDPQIFTFDETSTGAGGSMSLIAGNTSPDALPLTGYAEVNGVFMEIFTAPTYFTSIPLDPGFYSDFVLLTAEGCIYEQEDFTIAEYIEYEVVRHQTTIYCEGEQINFVAPLGYPSYLWNTGNTTPYFSQAAEFSTEYYVDITDAQGELVRHVYPVIVFDSPEAIFDASQGFLTVILTTTDPVIVTVSDGNTTLNLGDILNQVGTFALPNGNYFDLTLETAQGCVTNLGDFTMSGGASRKTILGSVWLDEMIERGIQEDSETGIEGVIVRAIDIYGDVRAEAVTDENGQYTIELEEDTYYFEFEAGASYSETLPHMGDDDTMDSDLDGSNGPGTTEYFNVGGAGENSTVDAGYVFGVLPVRWKDIFANGKEQGNEVTWIVDQEHNVSHYEIERSVGNISEFEAIGQVVSAEEKQSETRYDFLDQNVEAGQIYYYRIKQYDNNGKFSISKIVSVETTKVDSQLSHTASVFPNPVVDNLNVSIELNDDVNELMADLYDTQGRLVKSTLINESNLSKGTVRYSIGMSDYDKGVYYLRITMDDQEINKKLIVIK